MNKFLSATALVALMAAAPVYADDTTSTTAQQPAVNNEPIQQAATTANAADQTAAAPGFIQDQTETELLATSLIGQTVYNSENANVGDINDLVIDTNGDTLAVIIGVGGFLGIGEKNVAVPYEALTTSQDQDGNVRLVLDATRDTIENAPEFVRLQDQPNAQADQTATMAPDATAPNAMTPDANAPNAMTTDQMAQDQSGQPAMAPNDTLSTDQAATANTVAPDQTMAAGQAGFIQDQSASQLLATGLIGQTVYNSADENLGDINDLVIDTNGDALAVIIGVGGFLGMGEKNVAVSYDSLNPSQDQNGHMHLVLNADRDTIENAPAFVRLQDQPNQTATTAPDATAPNAMNTDQAATPDQMVTTDQMATTDQTDQMAQTQASQPAVTNDTMAADQTAAANTSGNINADAQSNTQMATQADNASDAVPGFIQNQSQTQLLASALINQTVYNGNQETLGDINDVLIDTNGNALAVIIGVGGFLGIGEKNVAVPYDAIAANQDSDGKLRLVLNVDRQALQDAPEFVKLQDQPDRTTTSSTAAPADTTAPANNTAN